MKIQNNPPVSRLCLNTLNQNKKYFQSHFDVFQVNFEGLKKSKFHGTDLLTVERFKAPIQNFNSHEDFERWAETKLNNEYGSTDYPSKSPRATILRKKVLMNWFEYFEKPNNICENNPALRLLIVDALTKDLKPNLTKVPPVLNEEVLKETIAQINEVVSKKPKTQLSFIKIYEQKLKENYIKDMGHDCDTTQQGIWVKIPSKEHDEKNFSENVKKLKALSHSCWCTKSINAKEYLSKGDFHIYLVNGNPKVGMRFVGDKIKEIQGVKNNGLVPIFYVKEIEKYIKQNSFKGCEKEIEKALKNKKDFDKAKEDLKDAIKNKDYLTVLNYPLFNCGATKLENGLLELEKYLPGLGFSMSELGIDENEMFDNIESVCDDVDLSGSEVTRFKNLKLVEGDLTLTGSKIKDTGSLEEVFGELSFESSKTKLNDNFYCAGEIYDADMIFDRHCNTDYIRKMQKQVQGADSIEKLFEILNIKSQKLEDGTYKINGYDAGSLYTELIKLKKMTEEDLLKDVSIIEGDVDLSLSNLKTLGNVKKIYGNVELSDSKLEDTGALEYLKGNLNCTNNKTLKSLGNIQRVDGDVLLSNSKVKDTAKLQYVMGNFDCSESELETLGGIIQIDGDLYANSSELKSLGDLRKVKGSLYLNNSKVRETKNLADVGKNMNICNSPLMKFNKPINIGSELLIDENQAENLDTILWRAGLADKSVVVFR